MIPKSKSVYNLSPYLSTAKIDNQQQYFQVFELPEKFAVGKNSFRLKANNTSLALGSPVFIDIRDSRNNPIYFEILNKKTQDGSRLVVIYITSNLPDGNCTILIGGVATGTRNWDLGPNVLYYKSIPLTTSTRTQSSIVFNQPPQVQVTEIRTSYEKLITSNNRRITAYPSTSNKITIVTPQVSEQFLNKSRLLDESEESINSTIIDSNTTEKRFFTSLSGSGLGPRTVNKTFGVSQESKPLPKFTNPPVVSTTAAFFSKSMEGGQLIVKRVIPTESIPGDATNRSVFAITSFTASIVKVINSQTAEIDTPLYIPIDYNTPTGRQQIVVDAIYDHTNFSASFVSTPSLQVTKVSESFAAFDFKRLDPAVGLVDKVHIKYKPIGSFGDYKDAGEFKVSKQNLLTDRLNYLLTDSEGFIEKPIGKITDSNDLSGYWSSYTVGGGTISLYRDNRQVSEGVGINYTPPGDNPPSSYGVVSTYSKFYFECVKDTEYNLQLRYFSEPNGIPNERIPQIEIYASGSTVTSGLVREKNIIPPVEAPSLGTLLTVISNDRNGNAQTSIPFKAIQDGYLLFNVVVRSGNWVLGDIVVTPNTLPGFTPNQARFNIPVDRFDTNSELSLLIEYYDHLNKKSPVESKVYGVYFSGSYKPEFSGSISYSGSVPVAKHDQTSPSTTWTFNHNLNQLYPVVTVYGQDSNVIIPQEINAQTVNTLIITFPTPIAGTAVAAGGNFVTLSGSCDCKDVVDSLTGSLKDWDNFSNIPVGLVSGSQQINYELITNKPSGLLSSSNQIATPISGAFTSTAVSLANATSILSSSVEGRLTPLEVYNVSTYYRGAYIGATATKPKLIYRESLVGIFSVEKVYVYVSASNTTFGKAEFYFTSGSLTEPYDPRSNADYKSDKQVGKVTVDAGIAVGYTSSIFTPSGWTINNNSINGTINFFVSGSNNTVLNNASFTTVGLVLKRI